MKIWKPPDRWSSHSPAPSPIMTGDARLWPAEFQEVQYADAGEWSGEVKTLHVAYLMDRTTHRLGSVARPYVDLAPSAAVARPGDGIRGGWSGRMRGRHLFIDFDRLSRIIDDEARVSDFERIEFSRVGEPPRRDPVVPELLRMLSEDIRSGSASGPMFGESVIAAIVHHLHGRKPRAHPVSQRHERRTEFRVGEVIDLIRSNLSQKLLLAEIAAEFGVSIQYVCRKFKEETGLPPHQYLLRARVRLARRLIEDGRTSLAETALIAGFADQSQMTTTFRKVLGATPAQFRPRRKTYPATATAPRM